MANIINQYGQVKVGVRVQASGGGGGNDADALAFITAASITDSTQQSAINTLVTDLKTYGIWTKMKAIYPFVGGTASSHKFNLKDPRDLDAAYRLVFNGGLTHDSMGISLNGTNGYADTRMNANSTNFNYTSTHVSIYSRTNSDGFYYDIGVQTGAGKRFIEFDIREGNTFYGAIIHNGNNYLNYTNTDSKGFYILNRTSTSTLSLFKNSTKVATNSQSSTNTIFDNIPVFIGALNRIYAAITGYSNRQYAFASIGDGLTDAEATAFYNAVQAYQTTLGRQVGVPIVADTDAQAFLNAAVITDTTQASAINTLVTSLKAANIWTKMKAIYPFVGGTATSHKFNLKDPRDLDAAYRLVFNGGLTHDSMGISLNGTNGYADTRMNANSTNFNYLSQHLSLYSRTNTDGGYVDMGVQTGSGKRFVEFCIRLNGSFYGALFYNDTNGGADYLTYTNNDSRGFYTFNRPSNTIVNIFKNSNKVSTKTQTSSNTMFSETPLFIGAVNGFPSAGGYTNRQYAFASIGDGLTDAEALAFYNAVQTYQTTLGRQV